MHRPKPIRAEMSVEELIDSYPASVGFLLERGVVCMKCGEPLWDTLGTVISRSGLDVSRTLAELRKFAGEH